MRIRKSLMGLAVLVAFATPALAAEDIMPMPAEGAGSFSGSVGFTTEYFFRGVSQTNDRPAIQGDIGYSYDFGPATLSGSVWGSNVNFGDTNIEMDYTLGLSGEVEGVSWDVGGIYYAYPGDGSALDQDYVEIYGALGYDFDLLSVGAGIYYSPDFQAESGTGLYYEGSVGIPLGKYVDLGASVGYQSIDKNANFGVSDWTNWKIGLSTVVWGFDMELAWVDTDLSDSECSECGRAVFSVSRSF